MDVDIGNALASVASPGVSLAALERLDERVATAHDRIDRGREDHEFGYAALTLPDRTDPDEIRNAVESIADVTVLLTIGIGGSSLGAATISNALPMDHDTATDPATDLATETEAERATTNETGAETIFLDNVDPAWITAHLESLSLETTAINVVSKSGTTAETLATFLVVQEAFESAGVDWTDRTIVTTGDSGPLLDLANRHDLPTLRVPEGVPGRFAALSPVGLVAAAVQGHDLDEVLAGANAEADSLTGSLFECPAYAYGATAYALDQRGAGTNVMMPYAESLETVAEWFAQLWAESLGKDELGQTPVRALGVTDQHSQLQLYRAGPRDKLVTFVTPRNRQDRPIPHPEPAVEELTYLEDVTLGELYDAEFDATEASLAAAGRPSVRIELERVSAFELGGLLYGLEAACILAGELYGVSTFDQPAVEWAKDATRGLLGDDSDWQDVVADKSTLRIER